MENRAKKIVEGVAECFKFRNETGEKCRKEQVEEIITAIEYVVADEMQLAKMAAVPEEDWFDQNSFKICTDVILQGHYVYPKVFDTVKELFAKYENISIELEETTENVVGIRLTYTTPEQ